MIEKADEKGLHLAFQCCEHLNRALIIERKIADELGYEEVTVVPWLHAGGSFSTNAYYTFKDPAAIPSNKSRCRIRYRSHYDWDASGSVLRFR